MNIVFYLHDEQDARACREKLLWLKSRFRMISGEELRACYKGKIKLKNACHITIDDGWLSTYRVIFPILKELSVPASIFVSPKVCAEGGTFWYQEFVNYNHDWLKQKLIEKQWFRPEIKAFPLELIVKELTIDAVNDLLDEYRAEHHLPKPERAVVNLEELKEMANSGLVEVGAHTMTHPVLTNETDERAEWEIVESVKSLESILGRPVRSFAYPNGLPKIDFGEREVALVRKSGVECAYSVQPGVFGCGNAFSIPRVGSQKRVALGRLGLILPSLHDQVRPRNAIRALKIEK